MKNRLARLVMPLLSLPVEADEPFHPVAIGLLSAQAVMFEAHDNRGFARAAFFSCLVEERPLQLDS